MFSAFAKEGYDLVETDKQSKEGGSIGANKSETESPLDSNGCNGIQDVWGNTWMEEFG